MSQAPRIVGKVQQVSTGYVPRPFQKILHNHLKRFNVLLMHRRFGKSVFAINETIDKALRCTHKYPVYGYFAPTFQLVEEIAWGYFQQFLKNVPGVEFNQQKLRVKIPRPWLGDHITIQLKSTDNPDSTIGKYYMGVVLDEYQSMSPVVFNRLLPTLSDYQGWCIIIGTARGDNDLSKKFKEFSSNPNWFCKKIRASESGVLPQEELDILRSTMLPEEYAQEMECDETAALIGSFYGTLIEQAIKEGRVGIYSHDPGIEVDTAWDLGMNDLNTIWFIQQKGGRVFVIDYLSDSGKGLSHYVSELMKKPYVYRYHYLPHDVKVRELGTGKTREDTLYDLGIKRNSIVIAEKMGKLDGINAVRNLLPKCSFDELRTEQGLKCLKNYQREFDAKLQTFKPTPLHNWASHGSDAFRTLAVAIKPESDMIRNTIATTQAITEYNPFG